MSEIRIQHTDEEFLSWLRIRAPSLKDLLTITKDATSPDEQTICHHSAAENLPRLYSEQEIAAFMQDESSLRVFVRDAAESSLQLGMFAQRYCSDGSIWLSPCIGCNTPYDNGGCAHENRPPPRRQNLVLPPACNEIHRNVKLLAALGHLLGRPDCQLLVNLVVPEPPVGLDHTLFCNQEIAAHEAGNKRGVLCILQMLALVDNASTAFPKAAMYAAGALSLAVCRCPSKALPLMDAKAFCDTLSDYFEGLFDLITNDDCAVEEAYGVVALNNVLPLMYWMADWKKSHSYIVETQLPSKLVAITINILHKIYFGEDDEYVDVKYDRENYPELQPAVNFTSCIQSDDDRPLSRVVGTAFEVLARWSRRGIPVSTQMIPTKDTGEDSVAVAVKEYLPRLDPLSPNARRLAEPIMSAFASNKIPGLPEPNDSFLEKPLNKMIRHCAHCGSSTTKKIFRCTGGCKGLACYCSPEHQRAHWKIHRIYCKTQRWD